VTIEFGLSRGEFAAQFTVFTFELEPRLSVDWPLDRAGRATGEAEGTGEPNNGESSCTHPITDAPGAEGGGPFVLLCLLHAAPGVSIVIEPEARADWSVATERRVTAVGDEVELEAVEVAADAAARVPFFTTLTTFFFFTG